MAHTIILGAVSPATAHLVKDYPYGFRLRCRKRYWLETAAKGAAKGKTRVMEQTTDPKHGDRWNKPKGSIYSDFMVLYKEDGSGHVKNWGVSWTSGPEAFCSFMASGLVEQFRHTDAVRAAFGKVVIRSQHFNATSWINYGRAAAALKAAIKGWLEHDPDRTAADVPPDVIYGMVREAEIEEAGVADTRIVNTPFVLREYAYDHLMACYRHDPALLDSIIGDGERLTGVLSERLARRAAAAV
jgi:hypothetical protein